MNPSIETADLSMVLGIKPSASGITVFSIMERIDSGLPLAALDRIAKIVAPADTMFKFQFIAKATYTRRKSEDRLSPEEGMKVTRIARVWSLAREVWGSDAAARKFLFRPHAMLRDQSPMAMALKNEIGAELVLDILSRLKYGVAA